MRQTFGMGCVGCWYIEYPTEGNQGLSFLRFCSICFSDDYVQFHLFTLIPKPDQAGRRKARGNTHRKQREGEGR
jgi:hypothetical protein